MPRPKAGQKAIIRSDDVAPQVIDHTIPETPLPFDASDIVLDDEAEINHKKSLRLAAKRKALKFGNELITIEIEPDDDPDSPIFVQSGHNGDTQYIWRGKPQTVKRKYVESFVAGKKVTVNASFGRKGDGETFNNLSSSIKGTYRVSLIEDKNVAEGGMKWFHSILSAPV